MFSCFVFASVSARSSDHADSQRPEQVSKNDGNERIVTLRDIWGNSVHADELRPNMHHLQPYRQERLASGQVCAICFCCDERGYLGTALMLPCGHAFHQECIRGWLSGNSAGFCPLGRCEVPSTIKAALRASISVDILGAAAWELLPESVIKGDHATSEQLRVDMVRKRAMAVGRRPQLPHRRNGRFQGERFNSGALLSWQSGGWDTKVTCNGHQVWTAHISSTSLCQTSHKSSRSRDCLSDEFPKRRVSYATKFNYLRPCSKLQLLADIDDSTR